MPVRAVLVAAVLLALAVPATADARARFFHFNACGSKCNDGAVKPVAKAIAKSILDFRPAAVSLNEMCISQFVALRRRLRRAGYPMHGRFTVAKFGGSNCRGSVLYGNAVLTRNRITWSRAWSLPRPDGTETRKLLCVQARLLGRRRTRICTTHLSPEGRGNKRRQLRVVVRKVVPWALHGRPVVLMGDFNIGPRRGLMDRVYGPFREVDEGGTRCRCGESTSSAGTKIDYIFVSARRFNRRWGDATHSGISDHDPVRGKAGRR
jgi:endonuclease/exonuclease/phosphatase family metal-dependent hydrolase